MHTFFSEFHYFIVESLVTNCNDALKHEDEIRLPQFLASLTKTGGCLLIYSTLAQILQERIHTEHACAVHVSSKGKLTAYHNKLDSVL